MIETPDFGPTRKWYSFLLWATSVPLTIMPIATSLAARFLTIYDSPKLADPPSPCCATQKVSPLWQRTVHRHLKKHGLLLVRIHQRAPRVLVIGTLIYEALRLADGFVHSP